MKRLKQTIGLLLLLSCFLVGVADEDLYKNFIAVGETIAFSNKPSADNKRTAFSHSKGGYDGSAFELKINHEDQITVTGISPSIGPKQDEFLVIGCTGNVTRSDKNVTITFEKTRKAYYVISLDKGELVMESTAIDNVVLVSQTQDGKPAVYYCSEKNKTGISFRKTYSAIDSTYKPVEMRKAVNDHATITSIHLTAVPASITKDDLYAALHPAKSIAHFTTIAITTTDGKTVSFPQGSYILCEGNSLNIN